MGFIQQLVETYQAGNERRGFFDEAAKRFEAIGTSDALGMADLVRSNPDAAGEIARQFGGWQGLYATHKKSAAEAKLQTAVAEIQNEHAQRAQAGQQGFTQQEVFGRLLPQMIEAGIVTPQMIGSLGTDPNEARAAQDQQWQAEDRPLQRQALEAQIAASGRSNRGEQQAPSGYRWGAGGTLAAIPGGPGDPAVRREPPNEREKFADEIARIQSKVARGERISKNEDRALRGYFRQFPGYAGNEPMPWEDLVEPDQQQPTAAPPAATPRANPPGTPGASSAAQRYREKIGLGR